MTSTGNERVAITETKIDNLTDIVDKNHKETLKRFETMEESIRAGFVTQKEFEPVQNIAYGMVRIILTWVVTSIITTTAVVAAISYIILK